MKLTRLFVCVSLLALSGCATKSPPSNPDNICSILAEKRGWYHSLKAAEAEWGIPVWVTASIIFQESSFRHNARPPAKAQVFGVGVGRVSSAYGYAQALDATWGDYKRETGHWRARRDSLSSASDFIGWYASKSKQINNVSLYDAKAQYLNYHEGWGAYRSKTYLSKPFLLNAASKVEVRASNYRSQLLGCGSSLPSGGILLSIF